MIALILFTFSCVSDRKIYYYVEWMYPTAIDSKEHTVLIIYNPKSQSASLSYFQDMELGLNKDVKENWERVKGSPDEEFSEKDIKYILESALDKVEIEIEF